MHDNDLRMKWDMLSNMAFEARKMQIQFITMGKRGHRIQKKPQRHHQGKK